MTARTLVEVAQWSILDSHKSDYVTKYFQHLLVRSLLQQHETELAFSCPE